MKKACIILAILLFVSALLTAGFGAAFGMRELRGVLEGNSRISDWFGNWHGRLEENLEKDLLGETRTKLSFNSMEPIFLSFRLAEVRVRPSEDGTAWLHLRYYGNGQMDDLSSLPYTEQEEDGLHLGIRIPDGLHNVSVTADLYLPDVKISSLDVQVNTGNLTVENMQFGSFEADVDVGEIQFKNSSADTAALSTNTGDLVWTGSSRAAQALSMHTDVGEIRLAWPSDVGFQMEYKTNAGDFSSQFEGAVSEESKTLGALARGKLRFGDGGCSVKLSAGVGDITLQSQAAQE